jgi:hypothetical protein
MIGDALRGFIREDLTWDGLSDDYAMIDRHMVDSMVYSDSCPSSKVSSGWRSSRKSSVRPTSAR